MVADPRSSALVENFAGQWLQIRNLSGVTPDPVKFPSFDESLRTAMKRETELFFGAVMKEDRSIFELIDSDFTYLNDRLARHYGIDGVRGPGFRRVSLAKGSGRGGVLTHASILTITSAAGWAPPSRRVLLRAQRGNRQTELRWARLGRRSGHANEPGWHRPGPHRPQYA